jgi:hypothetical protein
MIYGFALAVKAIASFLSLSPRLTRQLTSYQSSTLVPATLNRNNLLRPVSDLAPIILDLPLRRQRTPMFQVHLPLPYPLRQKNRSGDGNSLTLPRQKLGGVF